MQENTRDPPIPASAATRSPLNERAVADRLCDDLVRQGYGQIDSFLPSSDTEALLRELQCELAQGRGRVAGIGRGTQHQINAAIRNDRILWWDPQNLSLIQSVYWQALNYLRQRLNENLLLSLQAIDCHYAYYPPGAAYQRHRDAFRHGNKRLISCVYYLNPAWQPGDGGELRLYRDQGDAESYLDIAPHAGTLVAFLSQTQEHEVRPAMRDRYSIAAWLCMA